ncbi:MAG TPA: hypothetical protein VNT42_11660 [Sphingomonas sp.]|nr:hypothetical protein [Sphingomonas sp.]
MFLEFDEGSAGALEVERPRAKPISYYDRGLACACLSGPGDLIEAHKWFNLAAVGGDARGARARADIALDMTPREIVEAQRRARSFLRAA